MFEFFIKSTIFLFITSGLYHFWLGRLKIFDFNRYYLLGSLFSALIVPWINIRIGLNMPVTSNILELSGHTMLFIQGAEPVRSPVHILSVQQILSGIYMIVAVILLIRFIWNLAGMIILVHKASGKMRIRQTSLILIEEKILPYSFFNYIFLNRKDFQHNNIDSELLMHEITHCRQYHSLDVMIIELAKIILWFNPLIWFVGRAVKLNHEFLADSSVLSDYDKDNYQYKLLNIAFRNNAIYLASNFNYSFIKKRLIMMSKINSPGKAVFAKITAVFLFFMLAAALTFSQEKKQGVSDMHFDKEWWYPILKKHHVEPHAFNNFEKIFEMGTQNSIDNQVVTIKDAFFLIKSNDNEYIIIKSPVAYHHLDNNQIEASEGTVETYRFNSKEVKPVSILNFKNLRYQLGSPSKFEADKVIISH